MSKHIFYLGDALEALRKIPSESVQCVVTSPPYWGLRNYGVEGQLGLERIPDCLGWATGRPCGECYVCHMVEVFREVRRVLRKDGTLWLNLGDCYAGSWGNYGARDGKQRSQIAERWHRLAYEDPRTGWCGLPPTARVPGLKAKDLVGIPWRLALALQANGWWLRSDIVWAKPSAMPESVTDRPTRSHEFVFLFAKSGSPLFWTHPERPGVRERPDPDYIWIHKQTGETTQQEPRDPENWSRTNLWQSHDYFYDYIAIQEDCVNGDPGPIRGSRGVLGNPNSARRTEDALGSNTDTSFTDRYVFRAKRNKRSVWEVCPQQLPEEHFATFPEKLVEPCVLAGTSERGCCPECGAPWVRVVEPSPEYEALRNRLRGKWHPEKDKELVQGRSTGWGPARRSVAPVYRTVGWLPTCSCGHEPIPCTVLDPFGGSGTVSAVAKQLGRSSIYIDINPDYCDMAIRRLEPEKQPLFDTCEVRREVIA